MSIYINGVEVGGGGGSVDVNPTFPIETGITAYAGGGQANATALTPSAYNIISTVASSADSVKLQIDGTAGALTWVLNDGASTCAVFPPTDCYINDLAINTAYSLAAATAMLFVQFSATRFYTFLNNV